MQTFPTYHVSRYERDGSFCVTFFGSDADSARKGWRSIGCQSIPINDLARSVEIMERHGYRRELRSPADMAALTTQQ
jgi:hypothetical protein